VLGHAVQPGQERHREVQAALRGTQQLRDLLLGVRALPAHASSRQVAGAASARGWSDLLVVGAVRQNSFVPRVPVDPDVGPRDPVRWDVLVAVALGGALGSLVRWALGELMAGSGPFPWWTFVENVTGSFALGVLVVLAFDRWPRSRYLRPFLGVGVLGGFTTFSTYALDVRDLVADDRLLLAAGYLLVTLVAGLLAAWLGIVLVRRTVAS
jgi:fluoride exporter